MKQVTRLILAISGAAVLASCAGMDGGPLIRPGEPTGTLQVVNNSSRTFSAVLISHCDHYTYGFNRLPDGARIPPGGVYSFTVSSGCWDVNSGLAYQEARVTDLHVAPGGVTRAIITDPQE